MARPLTGHRIAPRRAISTPRSYADSASASSRSLSRSVAPVARTVRIAESARSTPAATRPTASCEARVSVWIRALAITTLTTATAITVTVIPSRAGSISAIATSEPTKTNAPPSASTSPPVRTERSIVVSEPTRDTRSPVRRTSYSRTGSRSRCRTSLRRALRTTPSAVRSRRYCCTAPNSPAPRSSPTSTSTPGPIGSPSPTAVMTRFTVSGWARLNPAPTREMATTTLSTARCSAR